MPHPSHRARRALLLVQPGCKRPSDQQDVHRQQPRYSQRKRVHRARRSQWLGLHGHCYRSGGPGGKRGCPADARVRMDERHSDVVEPGAAVTRPICAVDFTTNSINILVQRRPDRVEATDAVLPSEAIEDGKILQPVAVQLFLTRMLHEMHVDKPEIRLCLSDSACVSRFLDYPQMPMKDLEQSLRFEAGRELPVSPRNAYLGWQVLDEKNSRRRVLLVAAWRDVVEGYLQSVQGLGKGTLP